MKLHHLNCGTMCPFGGAFVDGLTRGIGPSQVVCHTVLVETNSGLVLLDTGIGTKDIATPETRISTFFRGMMRPRLNVNETAVSQVRRLGFSPQDVRHIVLTHLDFDHAGGIDDFPNATVHVLSAEKTAFEAERKNFITKRRYSPAQVDSVKNWETYPSDSSDRWFGFECVRDLRGLPPEILLIPLQGHTPGHSGIAIKTDTGWMLYAGDAYFYRAEIYPHHHHCTPGFTAYQRMMDWNHNLRVRNQQRLRDLITRHRSEVIIFSAHDPVELITMQHATRVATTTQEVRRAS